MIERESNSDYKMYDDEFTLPLGQLKAEGGDMQQYCNLYFKRLE